MELRTAIAAAIAVALPACSAPEKKAVEGPEVVMVASASPLVHIEIMVRAGSTADPPGKEGLAALTAEALIGGGFGDPGDPTTKEKLAAIVQPWGEGAMPSAQVAADTTTLHAAVPDVVWCPANIIEMNIPVTWSIV